MVSGRGAEHHAMALALRRDIGDRFPAEGRPADSLVSFQRSASIQRRMGVDSREARALDGTYEAYIPRARAVRDRITAIGSVWHAPPDRSRRLVVTDGSRITSFFVGFVGSLSPPRRPAFSRPRHCVAGG